MFKDNVRRIFTRTGVKQRIKFSIAVFIMAIVIAVVAFTVMKYEVEGEKNVPFKIGKIIVISSATTANEEDLVNKENGQSGEVESTNNGEEANQDNQNESNNNTQADTEAAKDEDYIWKEDVVQTNDIYIYLDKNNDCKEQQAIRKVKIDNIQILKSVEIGKIQIYMPSSIENELYRYSNEYLVNSTLTYTGASADNKSALQIGNQGGCVALSFANIGLGTYKSNDDTEIQSGGTILEKLGVTDENLKFVVAFDITIEVEDKSYKTTITLELPVEGIVGQKETHKEITDFKKNIFKRVV